MYAVEDVVLLLRSLIMWDKHNIMLMYRFAYVEFADKDSAKTALALDESLFKGRQLKVCAHTHNMCYIVHVTIL